MHPHSASHLSMRKCTQSRRLVQLRWRLIPYIHVTSFLACNHGSSLGRQDRSHSSETSSWSASYPLGTFHSSSLRTALRSVPVSCELWTTFHARQNQPAAPSLVNPVSTLSLRAFVFSLSEN